MMKIQATVAALAAFAFRAVTSQESIVDIAVGDERFSTLVGALGTAGLVEALQGDGPFTVFAPINEAFAPIPAKYIEDPEWTAHLTDVLLYHVVSGEVFSTDLSLGLQAETLNGNSLNVTSYPDPVQINGVDVIIPDIDADNGVIHVVDEVLLPPSATTNIVEFAVATPAVSTLVELVTAAGLVDTLSGDGPYTVFAPTNDAFKKLDSSVVDTLTDPANVAALTDVLTYHVVPGIFLSSELSVGDELTAANGDVLTVTSMNPPTINDSIVLGADILVNNGVIHTIDTVLIPQIAEPEPEQPSIVDIAVSDGRFTTLVDALTAADLVEALSGDGPFTVFAPVDEAFAPIPAKYIEDPEWKAHLTDILLYHVVSGEVLSTDLMMNMMAETLNGESVTVTSYPDPVQINGVDVIVADVDASNGVVHAIDEVLLPTSATSDIVDIAVADDQFSTLVELLTMADLVDVLKGDGPFTVFAPTNDAFGKLPADTVTALMDPANKMQLVDILSYHVVPGIILASELEEGPITAEVQRAAVNGDELTVTGLDPVTINDSIVVASDVLANNGVIHVIDTVLMPPTDEMPMETSSASNVSFIGVLAVSVFAALFM